MADESDDCPISHKTCQRTVSQNTDLLQNLLIIAVLSGRLSRSLTSATIGWGRVVRGSVRGGIVSTDDWS